jgi:ketosteroid isomerase-like protein
MLALIGIAAAAAAASPSASRCPVPTESAVRETFEHWAEAFSRRDLAGTMAIFAPNVRFQTPRIPAMNWTGIKDMYAQQFARPDSVRWVPEWQEVVLFGDGAAAFATWRAVAPAPTAKPFGPRTAASTF